MYAVLRFALRATLPDMAAKPAGKTRKTPARRGGRAAARRRRSYHHGNLREALVEATLELAREVGPENVSVREAARRAGVSPGAPFRHFADRTALMTAVAEEATRRLVAEIDASLAAATTDDPLERYRILGDAYLRWAAENPTSFAIVSQRRLIDYEGSPSLGPDNDGIQARMNELLREALRRGVLRSSELRLIQVASRALVYGLARMQTDGHFPSWHVAADESGPMMHDVLRLFLLGLRR
jgi:AcrR family transcriptional regulator